MSNANTNHYATRGWLIAAVGGVVFGLVALWLAGGSINIGTLIGVVMGGVLIGVVPTPRTSAEDEGKGEVRRALAALAHLVVVMRQAGLLSATQIKPHVTHRPPQRGLPACAAGLNLTSKLFPTPIKAA